MQSGVSFRVWASASKSAAVELQGRTERLQPEGNGYFSGTVTGLEAGALYKYRLDSGSFPDPASRFQPEGPHGPSMVVDPSTFPWKDQAWRGLPAEDLVLYELHLGTFTPEGTWAAAMEQLPELQKLGVTCLEIMPIAEFPGRFGWGYDGVDLFAPSRLYGQPDDVRQFVDRAHALGLMVILDVVYNHLGPDGNYLGEFSKDYFSTKHKGEWGDPLNFDGPNSQPVREFFISNARYWIEEFHFDGLRLDATQAIIDDSRPHLLAEISQAAAKAAAGRKIFLVGENEPQKTDLVCGCDKGGCGLDALWNDDYHHSAMVAATGRREAYYLDYRGAPQEFISSAKYGYLFQGQLYRWQKNRRGTPAFQCQPKNFVTFLENHDQVANSLRGERLHRLTSRAQHRALTALTLLGPAIPMLFQGEEFASSKPFLYFADHHPELNKLVSKGRSEFLRQFRSVATEESRSLLHDPAAPSTFERCKLDFAERQTNAPVLELYRDLLRLRREDPVLRAAGLDGAVLASHAFVLRYFGEDQDRLLLVNLGAELHLAPCPEPLLAPPRGKGWRLAWSSENPKYGGHGTPALETQAGWILPAHSAALLSPDEQSKLPGAKLSQED